MVFPKGTDGYTYTRALASPRHGLRTTRRRPRKRQKRSQRRHKEELDSLSSWIDQLEDQIRAEKEKFVLASRGGGSEVVSQLTSSTAVAAEAAANAAKVRTMRTDGGRHRQARALLRS